MLILKNKSRPWSLTESFLDHSPDLFRCRLCPLLSKDGRDYGHAICPGLHRRGRVACTDAPDGYHRHVFHRPADSPETLCANDVGVLMMERRSRVSGTR